MSTCDEEGKSKGIGLEMGSKTPGWEKVDKCLGHGAARVGGSYGEEAETVIAGRGGEG